MPMNDELQTYVTKLRNYALDHHIGCEFTSAPSPTAPSEAYPERRFMIINTNWWDQQQVPFTIAHEIGHIVNGDAGVLYFTPTKTRFESAADRFAIRLLVPMYHDGIDAEFANPHRFIEALHIPDCLETYSAQVIAEYYAA
jgi:Zn-dependent peptidase ImmA (M78 family)